MEQINVVQNVKDNSINTHSISIDAAKIDNAVLKRLIGEIDFERENHINAYNRTHNRHNRGR
jgi:hypothetical protein